MLIRKAKQEKVKNQKEIFKVPNTWNIYFMTGAERLFTFKRKNMLNTKEAQRCRYY